jgi:phosphoribosylglycinamide formyltransferase 2
LTVLNSIIVAKHQPDFIVPEIEAIRTERFTIMRSKITVVPSAKAANFTMNRKAIRDLLQRIRVKTANYRYATTADNCKRVEAVGMPCVVKPLMSSSGRTVYHKTEADIESGTCRRRFPR